MADLEPPRPVISGTLAVFDQETCDPNEWENFKRSIRPSFQNRRPRTAADNPGVVVAEDGAVFLEARGIGGNLAQLRMVFPIAGGQQLHAVLPQQTRLVGAFRIAAMSSTRSLSRSVTSVEAPKGHGQYLFAPMKNLL